MAALGDEPNKSSSPKVEILAQGEPRQEKATTPDKTLDDSLIEALKVWGFTGKIDSSLEKRLGRPVNRDLADLGRNLFFDKILALGNDNTCAGCHSPTAAFGDTQSIAIGVSNNNIVGPGRKGPRNQRRTPTLTNVAFYPALMWNGRFASANLDPFDNADGFDFPLPEGAIPPKFPPKDSGIKHLLVAQGHIPPTEQPEMAGFNVQEEQDLYVRFLRFGGERVTKVNTKAAAQERDAAKSYESINPPPDALPHPISGFLNEPIRGAVLLRLNTNAEYKNLFAKSFSSVQKGEFIDFEHIGQALSEFQISLTFADAPIDKFARGDHAALTAEEKRGAKLFFGKAGCVNCHSVAGESNEMFSDFATHVVGVPQIAPKDPKFGGETGNVEFKGPGNNEDFGLEDITGRQVDRYEFRTSPLRNVGLQPTFFHNGAFTKLEDAVKFHRNPLIEAPKYDPAAAGVAVDLQSNIGPIEPVLKRLDPLLSASAKLTDDEFKDLIVFLRHGLLDPRAEAKNLCKLIPDKLPSGRTLHVFEGCDK